jgi:tetratricopeptide (TPR) repeat protein
LNPNLASAYALIGLAKLYQGHPEETESHVREALHVSPRDTDANVWVAYMALAKLYLGAYEDALNLYHRSFELNPNYPNAHFNLVAALVELGRLDEARAEVQAGLALNPGFTIRRYRAATQATIRFSLKDASGSSKTCAKPGCRRDERNPEARGDLGLRCGRLFAA